MHHARTKQSYMDRTEQELSDEAMTALLASVGRERDIDAFEVIFRHYSPKLRAYMAAKTKDAQAAEELMQEAMMSVWKKAAQFDPARGSVSSWIFTIARNLGIDAHRRRRPMFDADDPAFVADETTPADVEVERRQDAENLREAMRTLPEEQLDILKRAFFDEASHSTIARELALPLGTVKSRIRLAFEKLRTALETRR